MLDIDVADLPDTVTPPHTPQLAGSGRRTLSVFEAADEDLVNRRELRRRALAVLAGSTIATLATAAAVGLGF